MDEKKMTLRLSDALLGRIRAAAEQDHRSAHAEILTFIEAALDARERQGTNAA